MKESTYNMEDKFKSEKLEIDTDSSQNNSNTNSDTNSINDINKNMNEEALIISDKETKPEYGK